MSLPHTAKDASLLWGLPTTVVDISKLFAQFCRGELKSLPWSDQPTAKETTSISEPLATLNESGFLTINSQPQVDGARSSDPVHGWGPRNGYCYQKVSFDWWCFLFVRC
jgi:methylenetetrahydrofolate reductase (NADPH)